MGKIFIKIFLASSALFLFLFINPSGSDPDGLINATQAQTSLDPPKIIQRSEWGADESIFNWEAEYPQDGKVKKIILHDTGSRTLQADPDGSGFYKEKVKNIYRYHVLNAPLEDGTNRRGFGDIGYHYLIDPNGNIYKGRKGNNGVIGAQVFGFNTGYVGVALIGTYGSEIDGEYIEHNFTPSMQEGLEKLVGWLASINEIDLLNQSQICGKDKKNNQVCKTVYGLTTHKVLAPSQDPGKIIEQKMIEIRRNAANYQAGYGEIPDGSLMRVGSGRIYLLENGKSRPFYASFGRIEQLGFDTDRILRISSGNLYNYPEGKPIEYGPDGDLLRGDGPEVYRIEAGKKRWITSATIFNSLGFNWGSVKHSEKLENYLSAQDLTFSDGSLLRADDEPQVYFVRNEKKHWIQTLEAFVALGFEWGKVIVAHTSDIARYNLGAAISSVSDFENLDVLTDTRCLSSSTPGVCQDDSAKIESIKIRIALFELPLGQAPTLKVLENEIIEITSFEDKPSWNESLNDNQFRGKVEVVSSQDGKKLWVVNELPLEDYLKGVAETVNDDPQEYQKAFAVAARSYAIFHLQNGGKHEGEPFHLKNTSGDQLYKGYGFEKRALNVVKAVEAINEEVMKFDGKIVRAVYSSDTGGISKDACKIWGSFFCDASYDYLRGGVEDPVGTVHDSAKIAASHGVGMSAVGARKMAENGASYKEILKHYYKGVEIAHNE